MAERKAVIPRMLRKGPVDVPLMFFLLLSLPIRRSKNTYIIILFIYIALPSYLYPYWFLKLHLSGPNTRVMKSSLPEQLFLDLRLSDVLDETVRLLRTEPWASQYCTAISETRYSNAIYARYYMDPQAKDGVHGDLRIDGDG
jgi:hypothetical protein